MQIIPAPEPIEVQQAKMRFGIVGNAPDLIAAIQRAILVAPINISVLVTGESGSGKEFFPKIIHHFSPRKHNKYIAVNCGAIPEGTIDSELFGHEKGAFTSAVSARKGYFEEADGGTIFLDEVAELPLPTQARLLRVLETGEFMKVGSSTIQRTDIRVVAATNVDMQKAIREGRFREDLYYRLSGVQIPVPPLRDRGNDILLLARKFAADFAERYTLPLITFSVSAREMMLAYRWPGNIRQLKNIVEQIAIFDAGNEVSREQLLTYIPENETVYTPTLCGSASGGTDHSYAKERELLFNMIFRMQREIDRLRTIVDEKEGAGEPVEQIPVVEEITVRQPRNPHAIIPYSPIEELNPIAPKKAATDVTPQPQMDEKEMIRKALERNDGRRKATAKELNISERTLYRKIKDYELE